MLLAIRERVMGILGWVILGFLFVAFAFFGLNSYLQSSAVDYAVKINGEKIPQARVQSVYEQLVRRLQQTLGEQYASTVNDEKLLRRTALDRVINDVLLLQAADDLGFTASDRLIAAQINAVEEFRKDGVFSKDRYQQILSYQGMTPAVFEYRLKGDIAANQLKSGVQFTSAVPERTLRDAYALQTQQRTISYLVIPAAQVADKVTVGAAAVEEYYSSHPDEFSMPERVRLEYLELAAADLPVPDDVDDEQLQALYNEHEERFVKPEERHARHILIAVQGDDDAAREAAAARAAEVQQRLAGGESFEDLARELSDDPGSSQSGGDLGLFGRGVMTPEFEQAVFAMQPGQRSEPVSTPFGLHIIELLDIKPQQVTPLEDVRAELTDMLHAEQRSEQFYDAQERLATLAFEQPDSLQGAAGELGLTVQQSDWLTRDGGTGLAENPDIVEAAFSEDVLGNHNNSEVISLGEEHVVVIRVSEHEAAKLRALDEVREAVTAAARNAAIGTALEEQGAALLRRLNDGQVTLEALAEELSVKLEQGSLLRRNAPVPARELVSKAFSLPYPSGDAPVYAGVPTADGNYAIIALRAVVDGSLEELTEAVRTQAWRNLNEIKGSNEMQMVVSELKAEAEISVPGAQQED